MKESLFGPSYCCRKPFFSYMLCAIRHKEHSVAVRSRTDLRHEVLLSSRARIRNVLVPHKSSSSMLKNFIRTAAFRDIITHPCLFFKSGRWKFNWLASLREMAQERDVIEIAFFTKHQGWYFKIGDITDSTHSAFCFVGFNFVVVVF